MISFKVFLEAKSSKKAASPKKVVSPSKRASKGNSPESALPADLASASTTPGTSTSTEWGINRKLA